MNGIFKRSLIALTCSSVLLLAACNDEDDGWRYSSCNGPRIVTTSLDDLSLKRGFKYGNT